MSEPRLFLADAIVLAGTIALTIAIAGQIRIPDVFAKIHAASKAVVLGVYVVLAASLATSGVDTILRALLVAIFLFLTSAVGSHALARLESVLRRR
jgi:multicomponent Na+:H+ antiporter subunit G